MAIGVYFHPQSLTADRYDEIIRRLESAGAGHPQGRLHHSCFGPATSLMVYDVWESQAAFDAFGEVLMPILKELEVDPGEPDVMPVHNMIT